MKAGNRHKAIGTSTKAKVFCFAISAILFALSFSVEAQQHAKIPLIGFLGATSPSSVTERTEALRQGLRELGYIEGKNIVIDWRYANGKAGQLPALAAELVRQRVDVIVTQGSTSTRAAQRATRTVPIVMTATADPVAEGIIASLAQPGGNITGLTTLAPELSGKRLELLKEAVPKASRVAVFFNPETVSTTSRWKEIETAAQPLELKLQPLEVRTPEDFAGAFKAAKKESAQAVIVFRVAVFTTHRERLINLASENKLPAMYELREFVEAGGLMSYSAHEAANYRRAAHYVDRILKGAKPADMALEQPTKFELWVNLRAAKQIGLTIPPNVLARADKVIR